jgi:hypothetical protein
MTNQETFLNNNNEPLNFNLGETQKRISNWANTYRKAISTSSLTGINASVANTLLENIDRDAESNLLVDNYNKGKDYFAKAITGTAQNGANLVGETYEPLNIIHTAIANGGMYKKSGVGFKIDRNGQVVHFQSYGNLGGFKAVTSGSTNNNDITTSNKGVEVDLVLKSYNAEVNFYQDSVVDAYLHNPGQLIAWAETVLGVQKEVLYDRLATCSIAGISVSDAAALGIASTGADSSILAANPTTYATTSPIQKAVSKMIASVRKIANGSRVAVYTSSAGANLLYQETVDQGYDTSTRGMLVNADALNNPYSVSFATMHGASIVVVPSMASDYQTNASGVILANGAGGITRQNQVVFIVAVVPAIGIGAGTADSDVIATFNPQNSYAQFSNDTSVVVARTRAGAVAINKSMVQYATFSA